MITNHIVDDDPGCCQFENLLDHQRMTVSPRPFLTSPKIDDIAISDQYSGLDALEIFQDGFRMAFVGSKVCIRNDDNLNSPPH
jgi:hypothetical protein